jgi:hypothetical protein
MAMVEYRECGGQVSQKADTWPCCGDVMHRRRLGHCAGFKFHLARHLFQQQNANGFIAQSLYRYIERNADEFASEPTEQDLFPSEYLTTLKVIK